MTLHGAIHWIDLLWLPLGFAVVERAQRLTVLALFVSCMVMMRLQIELVGQTGYDFGFSGLLDSPVWVRAMIAYSVFYALFLALVLFSPRSRGIFLFGAALSLFFIAMSVSMVVMVL